MALTTRANPSKRGVLLVNLGSPDSTRTPDVRRYLREFLMDERVLDTSWAARWIIVHFFILPFRPAKTAEAYRKIWWPEGSPLVVTTQRLGAELRRRCALPVAVAMRYQHPSIEQALAELVQTGIEELGVIPLYPQYALSSYETVVVRVQEICRRLAPALRVIFEPPFYDDPDYMDALVASAQEYLECDYDHLLFSFHGLPERHLRKSDPTGDHCLRASDCCHAANLAHLTCYRAQAIRIVEAFGQKAGLPPGKHSISFQSRLGRDPWLKPYTDHQLLEFPKRGIKKLMVICPAFVSDCLETLEEIGIRGRAAFLEAGGQEFTYIPCLNEHPRWLGVLEKMAKRPPPRDPSLS
jgi:protoporphyrin/coproporphyrin ferrochelatase